MKQNFTKLFMTALCLLTLVSTPAWPNEIPGTVAPESVEQTVPAVPAIQPQGSHPHRPQEFIEPGRWQPPSPPPHWNSERWMPPVPQAIPNTGYSFPRPPTARSPAHWPPPYPAAAHMPQPQHPLQSALDASRLELHRVQTELRQTRDLLKDAGDALDWAHTGRMKSIDEHHVLVDSLAAITSERDDLRRQLSALSTELDDSRETSIKMSDEQTGLGDELETCNGTITGLEAHAREMSNELSTLHLDIDSRNMQLAAIAAEVSIATEALQKTQSGITAPHRQAGNTGAWQQDCHNELSRLATEQMDKDSTLTNTRKLLAEAVAARAQLQVNLADCNMELASHAPAQALEAAIPEITPAIQSSAAVTTDAQPEAPAGDSEKDSDGDGIPDTVDLCPESQPGIATESTGCVSGTPMILEGVSFHYDSSDLTSESHAILDRVADILIRHPALRLEVAGHTDTQGDPAYNLWLSQERSAVVRDYLVTQGVAPGNLTAQGYGSQHPVAENDTREGLARNRRVELRTLAE